MNISINSNPTDKPTMISIADLVKRWGCSKNFVWERCKSGKIPSMKIDDRWFVSAKWVLEQEAKTNNLFNNIK